MIFQHEIQQRGNEITIEIGRPDRVLHRTSGIGEGCAPTRAASEMLSHGGMRVAAPIATNSSKDACRLGGTAGATTE